MICRHIALHDEDVITPIEHHTERLMLMLPCALASTERALLDYCAAATLSLCVGAIAALYASMLCYALIFRYASALTR